LYPIGDAKSDGKTGAPMLEVAAPKLTRKELEDRLRSEFPELLRAWSGYATIGGATMMALADYAMYFAVLSAIGWVPLAVTTNLSINFLRKPDTRDLVADARLLKLGKRLAVGEIGIRSVGDDDLVAHATATYSIPRDP
jgi:uncharacterized protein (TIGR00369 family)